MLKKNFVEIAGIKWATMNIGAEKETDIGIYFQWGDTQGYAYDEVGHGEDEKIFDWKSYKYGNGSNIPGIKGITKYNYYDNKTVLEASDDAVTAAWGDDWRMPTKDEFKALGAAVTTALADDYKGSGVAGLVCTDKTDSSKVLFFPACGYCFNGSVYNVGFGGNYWSRSLCCDNVRVYSLYFDGGSVVWKDYDSRRYGFQVRGVMK